MLYDEIKNNFVIPNAFENWTPYRMCISEYIASCAKRENETKKPTLAILGAGACNDFDLCYLSDYFSHITLLDYDESSMKKAMETYYRAKKKENMQKLEEGKKEQTKSGRLEEQRKSHELEAKSDVMWNVTAKVASLNGIGEEQYIAFCEELQSFVRQKGKSLCYEEFERYAICLVEHFLDESKRNGMYLTCLAKKQYDYVCCFGLHSQLLAMFSYSYRIFLENLTTVFGREYEREPIRFMATLVRENERFIPQFHDALLQCAKQKVFIGLEYEKCNKWEKKTMERVKIMRSAEQSGEWNAKRVAAQNSENKTMLCEKENKILVQGDSKAKQIETIEGAYEAIADLQRRNLHKKEAALTWPFAPQYSIFYNMLIEEIIV